MSSRKGDTRPSPAAATSKTEPSRKANATTQAKASQPADSQRGKAKDTHKPGKA